MAKDETLAAFRETRSRQPASEFIKGDWNEAEMRLAHAMAILCVRHGPRVNDLAAGIASYRERVIARLEQARGDASGAALERAINDIRNGTLV